MEKTLNNIIIDDQDKNKIFLDAEAEKYYLNNIELKVGDILEVKLRDKSWRRVVVGTTHKDAEDGIGYDQLSFIDDNGFQYTEEIEDTTARWYEKKKQSIHFTKDELRRIEMTLVYEIKNCFEALEEANKKDWDYINSLRQTILDDRATVFKIEKHFKNKSKKIDKRELPTLRSDFDEDTEIPETLINDLLIKGVGDYL